MGAGPRRGPWGREDAVTSAPARGQVPGEGMWGFRERGESRGEGVRRLEDTEGMEGRCRTLLQTGNSWKGWGISERRAAPPAGQVRGHRPCATLHLTCLAPASCPRPRRCASRPAPCRPGTGSAAGCGRRPAPRRPSRR